MAPACYAGVMHDPRAARAKSQKPAHAPRGIDFTGLRSAGFTPRQCEVLGWVAHGKRDIDIARILGISPRTVGKHIEHLLAKLHAENRTAAVSLARERLGL